MEATQNNTTANDDELEKKKLDNDTPEADAAEANTAEANTAEADAPEANTAEADAPENDDAENDDAEGDEYIEEDFEDEGPDEGIYQHVKRPQWGMAILVEEMPEKRTYQFDDGTMRSFKKGFYHLLEEVDPPQDKAELLLDMLHQRLEDTLDFRRKKANRKILKPVCPFAKQIQIFEEEFPGGFRGDAWQETMRGEGTSRVLKRHRAPSIAKAQELLGKEVLAAFIEDGDYNQVMANAQLVMQSTDLVGGKAIQEFEELLPRHHKEIAESLNMLLHGDKPFLKRFDSWTQVLRFAAGNRPGWRFATVFSGLLLADEQICVRPSSFKRQAGEIAPDRFFSQRALRKSYRNHSFVVHQVKQRLIDAGYKPQDFLDVHDFIWTTLRPSAHR